MNTPSIIGLAGLAGTFTFCFLWVLSPPVRTIHVARQQSVLALIAAVDVALAVLVVDLP